MLPEHCLPLLERKLQVALVSETKASNAVAGLPVEQNRSTSWLVQPASRSECCCIPAQTSHGLPVSLLHATASKARSHVQAASMTPHI